MTHFTFFGALFNRAFFSINKLESIYILIKRNQYEYND